ncbi:NmrA/HSCARG family protein [Flavitalea sp. BT771]|uniref:NmrA/HSCARG family protein n=1 Tax=Flavitalea sp. BT771 TaxID=3063329 RepID=UPI0026E1C2BF|nr:NmrA/HSCARG family protein [Flavitalea sp. BT771]MDO6429962.1 NmrA/HSCARG family protein [Flavitalea sp. BT771]MDV6217910.1 NmrA/HSCARG family protein [Flavitalea sp. BT771]
MKKKLIVVVGATGSQGKGIVNALVNEGSFNVRAITRNPAKYSGKAHEAVFADLNDLQSLKDAFKNAYGVFVVTNFWEGADEIAQGKNAIEAAKATGMQHFIWSTLPDVEFISNAAFEVPHFTGKSKVDELVKSAGFKYTTFVQPPFYYQNLIGMLGPQPKQDGTTGWTLPIDPTKKAIHMSDIDDLGKVVAGAFSQPEKAGNGNYLSMATELNSFNDIIEAYKQNGKEHSFSQVPAEMFSTFFEGAKELAEMFGYFEKYTYMGPGSASQIELAKEIATNKFVTLREWLSQNS